MTTDRRKRGLEPEALGPDLAREQGSYSVGEGGPLLVVTGGIHGNEPAGLLAARRVLRQLEERRLPLRGRLVVLAGNLSSLTLRVRYVEQDLNRMWLEEDVAAVLRSDPSELRHEACDQVDLVRVLEQLVSSKDAPNWEQVIFLDLHSTSAVGPPFTIIGDTIQNRKIAFEFGIPAILGLEENVGGTLLGFLGTRGYAAVGVEGGQHDDPGTIDNHEAAIWLTLVSTKMLAHDEVPEIERHRVCLVAAATGTPAVVEIRYRHGLEEDEDFEMVEGLANFVPVTKGRLLARTQRRSHDPVEVHCPEDGILLLPRYQGQGLDGFFIGRQVNTRWLALSAWLRRFKLDSWLTLLPGISRPETGAGRLRVDRRIARWLTLEFFHLLGYRKRRSAGRFIIFEKRVEKPRRN